jgi:hypothetical protein
LVGASGGFIVEPDWYARIYRKIGQLSFSHLATLD